VGICLERIRQLELLNSQFIQPDAFYPLDFWERSLGSKPHRYQAEALFRATFEEVKSRVPMAIATLTVVDEGVLLAYYTDDLAWLSQFLLGLRLPLTFANRLSYEKRCSDCKRISLKCLHQNSYLKKLNNPT